MARRIVLQHDHFPKRIDGPGHPMDDLTGKEFGQLRVLRLHQSRRTTGHARTKWMCLCHACGSMSPIRPDVLKSGATTCSCVRTKHGGSRTAEYDVFKAMHDRCTNANNPQYADYGGRGIRVCDRWSGSDGFSSFLADVGSRPSQHHSIDRYPDNDGNYEPGNFRWATRSEQQRNTRDNRMLTFDGKTMCVAEWAEHLGVSHTMIRARLCQGWSVEEALTFPHGKWRSTVRTQLEGQKTH